MFTILISFKLSVDPMSFSGRISLKTLTNRNLMNITIVWFLTKVLSNSLKSIKPTNTQLVNLHNSLSQSLANSNSSTQKKEVLSNNSLSFSKKYTMWYISSIAMKYLLNTNNTFLSCGACLSPIISLSLLTFNVLLNLSSLTIAISFKTIPPVLHH